MVRMGELERTILAGAVLLVLIIIKTGVLHIHPFFIGLFLGVIGLGLCKLINLWRQRNKDKTDV